MGLIVHLNSTLREMDELAKECDLVAIRWKTRITKSIQKKFTGMPCYLHVALSWTGMLTLYLTLYVALKSS
jgi:hypothetical protein